MENSKTLRNVIEGMSIYTKAYISLFLLFSLQIIPNDIILALSIIIFFVADLENEVYLYFFSLPWMYVGRFSFGLTISLVNTVLMVLKIVTKKRKIKFNYLELMIFGFLVLVGVIALVIYRTLTGISICFYFFIAVYMHSTYAGDEERCEDFWEKCLFIVLVSTIICIIYGFRANTGADRWIRGMGYVKQLYGTLGTSRFGLYLVLSLLYPLYYIHNRVTKTVLIALLTLAVFGTVSITSMVLLVFVLGYYVVTTGRLTARKIGVLFTTILAAILVVVFWNKIGNVDVFRPLYNRTNLIIMQLGTGDLDAATSGRFTMSDAYVNRFESFNILNKVVGGATLSAAEGGYSHNSYLDMLNYCGVLGTVLFACLQLQRIRDYSHMTVKGQAILSKLLFIITAATVSIFSAQFWLMFFFL